MVAYLDQSGVQHLIAKIRNTFWPVGTILATTTNTSPASYIGGSWEAYAPGRTLVGVDKNHPLNSTGGSATHTITQQELPPHVHDLFARSNGDTNMDRGDFIMNQWAYRGQYLQNGRWYPRLAHTLSNTNYAGVTTYPNNPMSIEQPYVANSKLRDIYIERIMLMHWIEMLSTIAGSVFASSGLWTLILHKVKQKDTELLMTRGMAHYRIIEEGQKFIERGWITHEEYDDFMKYLANPYLESGSNGLAKKIIDGVSDLPFKSISLIHSTMDH